MKNRNPAVKVIIILHLLFLVLIFTVFWAGLMQDPRTLKMLYRKNFLSDSDIINSYDGGTARDGRIQARPNRWPIPAHAPCALLRRQTPETLGSQRRYDELLVFLRTRPALPPAEDHNLRDRPSRL